MRFVLLCAMILIVAGGIVRLSLSLPDKKTRTPVSTAVPAFGQTGSTSTLNPGIPNPTPWQYDPVTNKHYDPTPGHVHWHTGLPPGDPGAAIPGATLPGATLPGATTSTNPLQLGNPAIPNPLPWQFDPVANKHWNPLPGHAHWHSGPAPPPDQRQ